MKITLKNAYGPFCPQELERNKLQLSKRELIRPHTKRELETPNLPFSDHCIMGTTLRC